MARRTDHTREALREMVLAAAREAVRRGAPGGLTARGLAGAIGYSPGTLYNLFIDLDDLILQLNGDTLQRLEQALQGAMAETASPGWEAVSRLTRAYVVFTLEEKNLWGLLFAHHLQPGRALPAWYAERIHGLLGLLEEALRPWCPTPEARWEAARVLWSGIHGICALAAGDKLAVVSPQPAEAMAATLVETFLRGVGQREEQASPRA